MSYAIGIDLGGTSVKAVVVSAQGKELTRAQTTFDPDRRMDWAEKIRDQVEQLERQRGGMAGFIGLCAPGLAAKDGRSIAYMPERLQGLEGLDWTTYLNRTCPVPVLNDAHAALLGESWLGAARGFENVILLTLGTGVGGAAMVDGRLLRGHIGRAGHHGHICLDPDASADITRMPGSLEDAIGNCTIAARTGGRFQTTHDLVTAHESGDKDASAIWMKSVHALACAIGSLVNVLDPEAVIIGGGIARSERALFDPLEEFLRQVEWQPGGQSVKVFPAQLGELSGAFGAAANSGILDTHD